MKKLIALLAAMLLVMAFTACSDDTGGGGGASTAIADLTAMGVFVYTTPQVVPATVTLPMGQNVHIQDVGGGAGIIVRFASAGEATTAALSNGDTISLTVKTVGMYNTYLQITNVYASNVVKTGTATVVYENTALADFNSQGLLDTVTIANVEIPSSFANNTTMTIGGSIFYNGTGSAINPGTYSFIRGFVSYYSGSKQLEIRNATLQLGTFTPPTLAFSSVPASANVTATTATINVSVNKTADVYCLVLPAGDAQPSSATIKSTGQLNSGVNGATAFSLTGLTASTGYKAWVYAEAGAETVGPTAAEFTTGSGTVTPATDLFISEYIEGSSSNKYIEIFNGTGATVNLAGYWLVLFSNGATTPGNSTNLGFVKASMTNNEVLVIANASATLGYLTYTSTTTFFNGDDAVALTNANTGLYVDIFGCIGQDPGTTWTSGSHQTLDRTLVRKSTVTGGVTTNPGTGFPTLETEWDVYPIDTVTYLGSHTYSP